MSKFDYAKKVINERKKAEIRENKLDEAFRLSYILENIYVIRLAEPNGTIRTVLVPKGISEELRVKKIHEALCDIAIKEAESNGKFK